MKENLERSCKNSKKEQFERVIEVTERTILSEVRTERPPVMMQRRERKENINHGVRQSL